MFSLVQVIFEQAQDVGQGIEQKVWLNLGLEELQVTFYGLFFTGEPFYPFFLKQGFGGRDGFPGDKKIADNGSKQKTKDDHLEKTVFLKKYRGTDARNYRAQQDANDRPYNQGDNDNN